MYKKIISTFISFLVMLAFTGCSLTERDLVEKTYNTEVPPVMMFLGDSIAAGYGLEGYTSSDNYSCPDSYANILKERYTTELSDICDHEMFNFAVSGADSADLLELIRSNELDDELSKSNAVVVSIGGNDLLNIIFDVLGTFGLSEENSTPDFSDIDIMQILPAIYNLADNIDTALNEFEENLKNISGELKGRTDGTIYIQTLYNPFETFTDFQIFVDFSNEKIDRLNEIIKDNSADNYKVIDVAGDFKGECSELTRIAKFDIHPNEKGHASIADDVDKAFRETGFTVTVQEYGEPHLTLLSILLIIGGILAMLVVVMLIIPKLFKKYENDKGDEDGNSRDVK